MQLLPIFYGDHPRDPDEDVLPIGTTADDLNWSPPFITGSLQIWHSQAVAALPEVHELSIGFNYAVDMRAGVTPDGKPYHGRIVDLDIRHIAPCATERAGRAAP
jgi:hypothetical protein